MRDKNIVIGRIIIVELISRIKINFDRWLNMIPIKYNFNPKAETFSILIRIGQDWFNFFEKIKSLQEFAMFANFYHSTGCFIYTSVDK